MLKFEQCTECSQNPIITVSENRRKFVIRNDGKRFINKVTVDGCLIDDDRERCDFLFEICNEDSSICLVYYVELKGCDIEKACKQLSATMSYCSERHCSNRNICYIVASRVPKAGTEVQNMKKTFISKCKAQLFVTTQIAEVRT